MFIKLNRFVFIALLFLMVFNTFGQEYTPFTRAYPSGDNFRYQTNIKGDLTFIGNQILNREGGTTTTAPEDGYNNLSTDDTNDPETGGAFNYNDYKNMQYVNVDPGAGRFNSSTANLIFPNVDCNLVRYAALYWSATYPSDVANGTTTTTNTVPVGQGRQNDFDQVQFRVPGGNYVNITADEVLFDGFTSADPSVQANSPYACYADVTGLVTALADPTGDYTVANIRATTGALLGQGGSTGGWTLVIVYENPQLTGKLITTFDGFARVNGTNSIDIPYNGFRTIPSGPVIANIGAATLEGDFRIPGDGMSISASANFPTFTPISNGVNPANNFFNSNITLNGALLAGRNPNSTNTLGYDTDIFRLSNFSNSVIDNGETSATFRFSTNGDQYYPFFNSFNIEIIEPEIVLEKRVEDIAGNDITGAGVNLGQVLDYVLSFRNIGNDNADQYRIRDVLPINVTLDESNITMPSGVSYTYTPATRTVEFTIPDDLVVAGSLISSIRMRVQVAENCFDFIDACTDLIQNLAFSTYQGEFNDNQITDDPSVTEFNNCTPPVPGATNFLLDDLENCNFTRTVQLCGDDVLLDAGNNFDDYVWVFDDNNNNQIDSTDTVLNDGNSDNDLSTLLVSQEGTYIVDKIVADPCKGFQEIMVVERFGTNTVNPIIDYFNTVNGDADVTNDIQGEIVTCGIDGDLLPRIFLCGTNDAQMLQTNITNAQSISWERLNEGSCTAAPDDCANKNLGCSWNQVNTGSTYTADTAGKYRLVVTYQNGCFNRFYFDVFQNNLNLVYNTSDIICTTDGSINITNLGSGYGFQLVDITNNNVLVPFSANNGPNFTITSNGQYRVDVTQLDSSGNPFPNGCIFSTPDIGILNRDFQVDVSTTAQTCNTQGTIRIDILNVEPNYAYILRRSDGTLIDDETAQPSNTHTFSVNEGDYIVEASTDDGCTFTQDVTVTRIQDPALSALTTQNIGCTAGTIAMTATGGFPNPDYGYAIWSRNGTDLYPSVSDIPGGAYQVEDIFAFGWRDTDSDGTDEYFAGEDGTYVFVVVDANGCFAFSNPVIINDNGPMTYTVTDDSPVTCSGENTASITINPTGGVAPYTYSINGGTSFQSTPTFVNLSGRDYTIVVRDASGCEVTSIHTIAEPFPLSASAGVSRDATCDPNGAEVRITNVVGGNAPYTYSFDGGGNYGTSTIAILPPGTYTVIVRDAIGCTFPMVVDVPNEPTPPIVTLTPEVDYNCDGSGNITATPNITTYDYTYELDGVLNAPDPSSNVFPNVSPGTYTVRTNYISQIPPAPSLLLQEDFGFGETIQNPNTTGYFYENQLDDVTPSGAPIDNGRFINDYEYAVTDSIARPFGSWLNPVDHTTGTRATDGRYLVINIGAPTPGQIIYQMPVNDIIANQPISVSLWLINLIRSGNRVAPDLTIELRHPVSDAIVASANTGSVPENNIWNEYILMLDPGSNTSLNLVITTNESEISGNDVAIDDISVFQNPEVCPRFVETVVTVVAGNTFEANIINTVNVSCNGLSNGAITFEVENFDATAGFDYSIDGGTTYTNSTTSPVTTAAVFGAGNQTILIRKADDFSCSTTIAENITEPAAIVASASITTAMSCTNGGATITANATGGTPGYQYQLEDTSGTIITAYQTPFTFTGIGPGSYIIRTRDNNLCEDPIDVALTVAPTNTITFDATPTLCYSGATDASIQVDVTNGNGDYTFSINGGPWVAPNPTNATTYTFSNLASGTYTINVSDGLGCIGIVQSVTINPQLTVSATAPRISACATATDITISASGGDTNYVYAVIHNGNVVGNSDFSSTNPAASFTPGTYDVYVRDNGGSTGYCTAIYTISILQDAPIAITPTPTPVTCFGGSDGAISIVVDSGGAGPFQYSIDGGLTYQVPNNFPNLSTGTYPIQVRDANNCESAVIDVLVTEPDQLVAEAIQTQNYTCNQLAQITVGSVTPTTGGSGNYQYSINGGTWSTATTGGHTFVDLNNGTYSIRVRDAITISCEITLADVIIAPLPVEPTLTTAVTYNCDGSGTITISPFDSTYTYILNGTLPGQTGSGANVFTNVGVGAQSITVNYGNDCIVDTTVIVEPGNAFEASITAFENLNCNADNSGTITLSANNFGAGGYEYSLDGSTFVGPFSSTAQITGLAAQLHIITIRDFDNPIAGCTVVLNQELTEPDAVAASANITEEFTCNNTGATITASAIGGTPTYVYQLEDNVGGIITAYQMPAIFTNVPAGDYIVRVRDVNNCSDAIDTAITVVAPANPTFTATPTACYSGNNDGSIIVDVTSIPGNGGFQFSINSGPFITPTPSSATTHTFSNLSNGTYTIDVRDAYGCAAAQQNVTINAQLTANALLNQDLTCLVDASITITPSGGSGTFTYEWGNSVTGPWNTTGFTSNVFSTNTAGTYFFRVTDTTTPTSCEDISNSIEITPAIDPEITSITPTNLNCNADNSGALNIVMNTSLGLAPYVLNVENTSTSTNFGTQTSGLPAGNYTVTLTDAKGCTDTETATITEPDPINYTATSVPITCDNVGLTTNPGSITISATTGGTPEYTYILTANNGIPTQTYTTTAGTRDHTFNILNFGIYQIDIVDANGCASFSTEIIASPPNDLDIDVSTATADCATGGTAIVTVGAAVGSGNYEFAILETFASPYSSTYIGPDSTPIGNTDTATFTGLTPGITYTFVVHDLTTNCYYFETADAPIDTPSNMTTVLDAVANVTCTGSADGTISFTFDNYDASATAVNYEIFNSQSNVTTGQSGTSAVNPPTGPITVANFATLPPGEYYLLLSEVGGTYSGCTVFGGEFTIRESVNTLDVDLTITQNDNCNPNAGIITANGRFGTAPYEYQFLPSGSTAPTISTWAGTSTNVFNGEGGIYDVYIKDANNCIQVEAITLPTDPSPEISLNIVNECVPEGTYQVEVTLDAAGIAPYALSINGGAFQNITFNGSGQYLISNLSTGAGQTVEIRDLNGCGEVANFTIQPPLQFTAALTTLLDCEVTPADNAEITIDITAGSGNYDYEISGPVNQARTPSPSNNFTWDLASLAGTYRITVYDTSTAVPNCSRFIDIMVPVAVEPLPTIDAFTNVTCFGANDGTISVSAADNGIGPFTFEIISGPGSTASFPIAAASLTDTSASFTGLEGAIAPGISYTIRATGSNGCFTDITQEIIQPDAITNINLAVVEFACTVANNQNNASITVQPGITGGSGNYVVYEFINDQGTAATGDDVVVQSGPSTVYTETNTDGGTYIINVYDDNGCVGSTTETIQEFVEISDPTASITQHITCNPGNDAEVTLGITLNPGTGTPTLNYSVTGTDNAFSIINQTSNVFPGLGVGNYIATVTNADTGCFVQTTFEIEDPNNFEIASTVVDVICFGDDGSVSFTIDDPVNPYTGGFSWQIYESQGTEDLLDDVIVTGAAGTSTNLGPTTPFGIGAGEYRVEIIQDTDPSCINNARFTIAGPSAAITADTQVTPITCNGNDGVIEIIDVLGGWSGYSYYVGTSAPTVTSITPTLISDYITTRRFENLAPGTYQVWVIDQQGCEFQLPNEILTDPTPIDAVLQLNQANCPNFTGEIEVMRPDLSATGAIGGQGSNYSYQLIKDGMPVGAPQDTTVFSNLDAGVYTVSIEDQWACTFTTITALTLYEPIVPLATVVKTIDCTTDPGGQITISQTGGSGNFDYEVRYPGTLLTDPADASNATGVFTALTLVGDYVFTITDQVAGHACPVAITQNLQDSILPILSLDAFTHVTCNGADDGSISVSVTDNGVGPYEFSIVDGAGSTVGTPILPTSSTSNSATFTGLSGLVAPGITYTIRATGANDCFAEETQTVLEPEIIDNVNATVLQFGCTAGNNPNFATISIDGGAITGGSGVYVRYEFIHDSSSTTVQDGPNTTYTETNLTGGDYTINVYDENGCVGFTTAVISPFVAISDPVITTDVAITCNPGNDSEIQVSVTMTPPVPSTVPVMEYVVTGVDIAYAQTNNSGTFTGLGVGNYTVSITNLNTGCLIQTTHQILDPDIIEVVATKLTDEECLNNGIDDGSFSVAISNYTGNFSYQVFDLNNNPVIGFSGPGNTSTPLIISNLPGGGYYVRITETDLPLCEENSNAITIVAPPAPITIARSEQASPSCTNDQGSILVDPEGGTGPYAIVLENTTTTQIYTETGVEAFLFTDLSAGVYTITVTDAMGCPETETITLIRPDNITATISTTPLVCFNGNTATVFTTEPTGRNVTAVYQYQLNSYDDLAGTNLLQTSVVQASTTFTGISTGFYSITITDDFGCSATSLIEEVVNPTEVVASLIRTRALTCDPILGVELELSATGGFSSSYEYRLIGTTTWIPMSGSSVSLPPSGRLDAGTYQYEVRDAVNGCTAVASNEVTEDPIEDLELIVDDTAAFINCNGDNTASIYATATGGLGNYLYALFTDASLSIGSRIAGPIAQGEFNMLTAGTYYVTVVSEDCTTAPQEVVISEPTPLDYTDEFTDVLCFGDENGTITVTLSGGSGGYQYAISPNLNQFDDENIFDELAPGDYTVIAQDQNGCFIELQYTINEPEALNVSAITTPEICTGDENGIIDLTITGGTAPYSTRLSTETSFVQDRISFTEMASGGYIIFVRDANECEFDLETIIEPGVNLAATVEPVYECTGVIPDNYVNITLEDTSVMGDILYALDSTDPDDLQLNPDFRNSAPGSHYIRIAHSNGCFEDIPFEIEDFEPLALTLEQLELNLITASATGGLEDYTFYFDNYNNGTDNTYRINRSGTYVVRVVDENGCEIMATIEMEFIDIEIPDFFTPDGDGLNDRWLPENIEGWPEILIKIYDRYGRVVEDNVVDKNGWDGVYNTKELPSGDYWYVIKLNGENDDREFVGHFTLYR